LLSSYPVSEHLNYHYKNNFYFKPWAHGTAFFVGSALGIFIINKEAKKIKIVSIKEIFE